MAETTVRRDLSFLRGKKKPDGKKRKWQLKASAEVLS